MRVVVLPGMDGGASLSRSFRAELATSHDVVGVEYPPDTPWSYARIEEHVSALLRQSGAPTLLVAESFSGPVAIRIAAAAPEPLVGLVLVATFAVAPLWPGLRHLVAPSLFWTTPPAFVLRRVMIDADTPDEALRDALKRPAAKVMSLRLREVLGVDVREELSAIELPTTIVRATRDRLLPERAEVSRHRPDLPVRELDAPHLVLHARPEPAARIVSEAIDDLG